MISDDDKRTDAEDEAVPTPEQVEPTPTGDDATPDSSASAQAAAATGDLPAGTPEATDAAENAPEAATEAAEPVSADEADEAATPDAQVEETPTPAAEEKPKATRATKAKADDAPAATGTTPEERARTQRDAARTPGESRPVRAVARYLRFSAQKGRLVVDQVRGKKVLDAATALAFSDRGAAREIMKVLKSAVANAENNHGMRADGLYVSAAFVDEGPTFKRWKPRARGRADKINKRTCHVTIVVDNAPAELLEGRSGRKAAASRGDRSARVAGSKKAARQQGSDTPKKGASRKPAAKKSSKKTEKAEA